MDITQKKLQIAVLIDSDNVSSKYAPIIFNEIETYGFASYRRIYGNWSKHNGWDENILLENSITPIQQFNYTTGKNSTDMTMVIDAMDILYSGNVDGFCLVTSDSDFTRLAMRLRESNIFVIGMGESKTPTALTKACNKFIRLNLISDQSSSNAAGETASESRNNTVTSVSEIENAIITIVNENENNGKITYMGEIGNRLNSKFPDFDVRNYGYTKLLTFLRDKCPRLDVISENSNYFVSIRERENVTDLHNEIISLIQKNGGTIDNLSVIYNHLKKLDSDFDLKDYGYSRISSFLRSMPDITVKENAVSLKTKSKTQGRKRTN